jgi:hypothetical protein
MAGKLFSINKSSNAESPVANSHALNSKLYMKTLPVPLNSPSLSGKHSSVYAFFEIAGRISGALNTFPLFCSLLLQNLLMPHSATSRYCFEVPSGYRPLTLFGYCAIK